MRISLVNVNEETVDSLTFTKIILYGKLHS